MNLIEMVKLALPVVSKIDLVLENLKDQLKSLHFHWRHQFLKV